MFTLSLLWEANNDILERYVMFTLVCYGRRLLRPAAVSITRSWWYSTSLIDWYSLCIFQYCPHDHPQLFGQQRELFCICISYPHKKYNANDKTYDLNIHIHSVHCHAIFQCVFHEYCWIWCFPHLYMKLIVMCVLNQTICIPHFHWYQQYHWRTPTDLYCTYLAYIIISFGVINLSQGCW